MRLDLRRDFVDLYAHLAERVRSFDPKGGNVLGDRKTVKAIAVGYEYAQAGWFVVVFDTRSDAGPDGEWTLRIDGNELERPHWLDNPITLIQHDGSKQNLTPGSELAAPLGEMIKAVLLKARADNLFASLPKAKGCELLIEHFDGGYGWPEYEARGKVNLVEP